MKTNLIFNLKWKHFFTVLLMLSTTFFSFSQDDWPLDKAGTYIDFSCEDGGRTVSVGVYEHTKYSCLGCNNIRSKVTLFGTKDGGQTYTKVAETERKISTSKKSGRVRNVPSQEYSFFNVPLEYPGFVAIVQEWDFYYNLEKKIEIRKNRAEVDLNKVTFNHKTDRNLIFKIDEQVTINTFGIPCVNRFFSIQKVDQYESPLGEEKSIWYPGYNIGSLLQVSFSGLLQTLNFQLEKGNYYRVKIATDNGGWKEINKLVYIEKDPIIIPPTPKPSMGFDGKHKGCASKGFFYIGLSNSDNFISYRVAGTSDWTSKKVPEEVTVSFDGGDNRTYIFEVQGLEIGKTFEFKAKSINSLGELESPIISGSSSSSDCMPLPDYSFEQALIDLGYDYILDGNVSISTVSSVKTLNMNRKNITDLTGIEYFTSLEKLVMEYNSVTNLDLSSNTNLTYVDVDHNQLTSLDLGENMNIYFLDCQWNKITSLDVSANTGLKQLYIGGNRLTSFDLTHNPLITHFYCYYSSLLTSLNLRNGNSNAITYFTSINTPNLKCISVDDPSWSTNNWKQKDINNTFSNSCGTTRIGEFESQISSYNIYPTLVNERVIVSGSSDATYQLMNSSGATIIQGEIRAGENELNLNELAAGIYYIKLNSSNGTETFKLLKD